MTRRAAKKGDRYHHGDLRRALIDAALSLIDEKGMSGTSLRGAARRAGVTHAAPYRHFRDKSALLAAVGEEGFQGLREALRRAAAGAPDDPLARNSALGLAYIRFAIDHPAHYRVMFGTTLSESREPALHVAAEEAFSELVRSIEECQAAGQMPGGEPRPLAILAWSTVHGMSSLFLDGFLPARNEAIVRSYSEQAVAMIQGGLL